MAPCKHTVVESHIIGKSSDLAACEDVMVITDDFIAVIDGATDKSGRTYNGMSGGKLIALSIRNSIINMEPEITMKDAVAIMSAQADRDLISAGWDNSLPLGDRPCASFVLLSLSRREIWRVGDQHFAIDGVEHIGSKHIDTITAAARSLFNALCAEVNGDDKISGDPGRELIMPILKLQSIYANHPHKEFGYGVINGMTVPKQYQEVYDVSTAKEIVLASDGYPGHLHSLEAAERYLAYCLEKDPMCVNENRSTKGLANNQSSFDDRAYVRIAM